MLKRKMDRILSESDESERIRIVECTIRRDTDKDLDSKFKKGLWIV